jgi:hypothetical protein
MRAIVITDAFHRHGAARIERGPWALLGRARDWGKNLPSESQLSQAGRLKLSSES